MSMWRAERELRLFETRGLGEPRQKASASYSKPLDERQKGEISGSWQKTMLSP